MTAALPMPNLTLGWAFALAQEIGSRSGYCYVMAAFLYRCPNTDRLVQGWSADEMPAGEDSFKSVTCLACSQPHFVNRTTGRVLGADDDE